MSLKSSRSMYAEVAKFPSSMIEANQTSFRHRRSSLYATQTKKVKKPVKKVQKAAPKAAKPKAKTAVKKPAKAAAKPAANLARADDADF